MQKIESDIATLEREIATLNEKEAIERATPAALMKIEHTRLNLEIQENKADLAHNQFENLKCLLDEAQDFRGSVPVLVRDRRMSIRRLELAAGASASPECMLSLHRHEAGTIALEFWAENFEMRMKGLNERKELYGISRDSARDSASSLRDELTRLESEHEKNQKAINPERT